MDLTGKLILLMPLTTWQVAPAYSDAAFLIPAIDLARPIGDLQEQLNGKVSSQLKVNHEKGSGIDI